MLMFFLPLTFDPEWFATNKMLEKSDDVVFYNDDIDLDDIDSDSVTFSSDDLNLITKDLNNISLDDDNFDDDHPGTIISIRFMA